MTNRTIFRLILVALLSNAARLWGDGLPEPVIPHGLGANIHFVHPDEREVDRIAQVGYNFVRMDFSWGATERSVGEYNFDGYDQLVASMAKRDIRCLFIFDYSNRLYDDGLSPHTDAGRKAFAKWAAAAAKHFAGKNVIWEIWNEPNISQFWKPKPSAEDWAALALEVIPAVKQADPRAFIIGPASSTFPWPYFQVLADKGVLNKLDAVSVHPYRQNNPETVEKDYQRLRLLIDRHSDHYIPIVSGEWGFSTGWRNMSEEKQGQYLPREWLANLANDVNLSIWYDWKDDGADPKEPEHHFGSVHQDLSDKPASIAAKKLVDELKGLRFIRRLAVGGEEDYALLFADDSQAKLALWTTGQPHKLSLAAALGEDVEVDGAPKYLALPDGAALAVLRPARSLQTVTLDTAAVELIFDPSLLPQLAGRLRVVSGGKEIGAADLSLNDASGKELSVPANILGLKGPAIPVQIEFSADGQINPLHTARVTLLVKNAIGAMLLPSIGDDATVLIDNPSGEPFKGLLKLSALDQSATMPLALARGQTSSRVALRFHATVPVTIDILNSAGKTIAQMPPVRWRALATSGAWKAHVEGDAKTPGQIQVMPDAPLPEAPHPALAKGLEISYQFGNGWKYAVVSPPDGRLAGVPKELGMWVHGDGSGNMLRSRFNDASGQTFQSDYGQMTWTGWKWVSIPLTGTLYHWGKGDGTIHYPIKLDAVLLIDNEKLAVSKENKVYIAAPAVRE